MYKKETAVMIIAAGAGAIAIANSSSSSSSSSRSSNMNRNNEISYEATKYCVTQLSTIPLPSSRLIPD